MTEQLYSIKQKLDTEEYHIFLSKKINNICKLTHTSICGKMENDKTAIKAGICINAQEVRSRAEKLGRKMCGICISKLYKTPPK